MFFIFLHISIQSGEPDTPPLEVTQYHYLAWPDHAWSTCQCHLHDQLHQASEKDTPLLQAGSVAGAL